MVAAFRNAYDGLKYCFKFERNFKIHTIAALLAAALAWRFNFDKMEIIIIVFAIAMVFMAELFNTAIEIVVDMIHPEIHPLAKIAKDIAAGAVLIAAMAAFLVGCILFYRRFL
ncbi:diacylglycerol kinase family protein [bacterium BFN5]|nr:diacylglycerol kinase family protein [bacterium BFN5]QJW49056.1 diacylglycerol kinase family protein [bacterium BFN5]